MTLRKHQNWGPKREPWKAPAEKKDELLETTRVQTWDRRERPRLQNSQVDRMYNDYLINRECALNFCNNEKIFAPIPAGWHSNESMVPPEDIALLPGRVFAFVLRTRTFGKLIRSSQVFLCN